MGITDDPRFITETIPPALMRLGEHLRNAFDIPAVNIGTKGNEAHRRGYHRSRAFLQNSSYAKNRTYSVTEPGNAEGNSTWVCALDITLPADKLIAACKRLDEACRKGRADKIAEWYGNTGGDNRVDGYDNLRNVLASSDSSHLWHLHLSFLRSRANEDHTDIARILTGEKEDTMTPGEFANLLRDPAVTRILQEIVKETRFDFPGKGQPGRYSIGSALKQIADGMHTLTATAPPPAKK